MVNQQALAVLGCRLDAGLVAAAELRGLLSGSDPAVVHACVLQLDKALRDREHPALLDGWESVLPAKLLQLPFESQCVVAQLIVDGLVRDVPPVQPTPALPPLVRLAWLRAGLVVRPEQLGECADTELAWEAIVELPSDRVIACGLLAQLAHSRVVHLRRHALQVLRTGLERGLLARAQVHAYVERLAHDGNVPIALEALRLLQEPWTFGLPLAALDIALDVDLELGREVLRVYSARGALTALRRVLTSGVPEALLSDLLGALGTVGDAHDVASLIECARLRWSTCGAAAVTALQAMKRRGLGVDAAQACTLLALFVDHPARIDVRSLAEVLSSRADVAVEATAQVDSGQWRACISLLEALGTRGAIARLRQILGANAEREGWPLAIAALGRLGIVEAEEQLLKLLDDEPLACLEALRHVGGSRSAQVLRARVTTGLSAADAPFWLQRAAVLSFRLDPSEGLLQELLAAGLLTAEVLGCLPEFGAASSVDLMGLIAGRAGDPRRAAAIGALGRTGGPAAVEPLRALLADDDTSIREAAIDALRALGRRLHVQRAAYPAHLESSPDPAQALLADALVGRLRERPSDPEVIARLLETLTGLRHPQLVVVVRPYLRRKEPEVCKRALSCLALAGPEAAAWILPWVSSNDVTVARQALRALMQTRAVGLAEPVARWLDAQNMNLKKTAAEVLAVLGDSRAVPRLLYWLSVHDNAGFRGLLSSALHAILGRSSVAALIDSMDHAPQARQRELLIEALSGMLSARDVAAIVAAGALSAAARATLLACVYDGRCALSSGTLTDLDIELERHAVADQIVDERTLSDVEARGRLAALRAGRRLALALRRRTLGTNDSAPLAALLAQANVQGQMVLRPSRSQVHPLLSAYSELQPAARAGALQLLSVSDLGPLEGVLVGRLLAHERLLEVPPALLRWVLPRLDVNAVRPLLDTSDREVLASTSKILRLDAQVGELSTWSKRDAKQVFAHGLRHDALDACFDWARQHDEVPAWFDALQQQRGTAFALGQARHWLQQHPALASKLSSTLCALGAEVESDLERLALSPNVELAVRLRCVTSLLQRGGAFAGQALSERLLDDPHVTLRECAARALWSEAEPRVRAGVMRRFLAGEFREEFRLQLGPADLSELDLALNAAQGPARSRAVLLLQGLSEPLRAARLLGLWRTSQGELQREARDALRAINPTELLQHLRSALHAGDEQVLTLLGPCQVLPAWLIDVAARSRNLSPWLELLQRMAAGGALHAPGLSELLMGQLSDPTLGAAVLNCLLCCDDWSRPERTASLLSALAPVASGARREEVLAQLVVATEALPPAVRVNVLTGVGTPADAAVVLALMDLLLANSALRGRLPPPMLTAIERRMRQELNGSAERARRVLASIAASAQSQPEREELILLLERGLQHPSSRVHLFAHRLLRTHADRLRYLEATQVLLDSPNATTVRSAIRTLAFGRSIPAVARLAGLVFHSDAGVRKAAADGLCHLLEQGGSEARAALTREMNHARPDRRLVLQDLLSR